jgi:hypothetical protein
MKTYRGAEVWIHLLLTLAKKFRWVVSFTPLPLYLRGSSPRHPLHRGLGGPKPVWMLWRKEKRPSSKVIAYRIKMILSYVESHFPFLALCTLLEFAGRSAPTETGELVNRSAKLLRIVRKINTRFTNPAVREPHLLPLPWAWIMLTKWTSMSFCYQRTSDSLFSKDSYISNVNMPKLDSDLWFLRLVA